MRCVILISVKTRRKWKQSPMTYVDWFSSSRPPSQHWMNSMNESSYLTIAYFISASRYLPPWLSACLYVFFLYVCPSVCVSTCCLCLCLSVSLSICLRSVFQCAQTQSNTPRIHKILSETGTKSYSFQVAPSVGNVLTPILIRAFSSWEA